MNGEALRDAGVEQAGSGVATAALGVWRAKAWEALRQLRRAEASFSAEDVRRVAGEPPTANSIGAIMREAYVKGWIIPAGVGQASRPSRHASLLRFWTGANPT